MRSIRPTTIILSLVALFVLQYGFGYVVDRAGLNVNATRVERCMDVQYGITSKAQRRAPSSGAMERAIQTGLMSPAMAARRACYALDKDSLVGNKGQRREGMTIREEYEAQAGIAARRTAVAIEPGMKPGEAVGSDDPATALRQHVAKMKAYAAAMQEVTPTIDAVELHEAYLQAIEASAGDIDKNVNRIAAGFLAGDDTLVRELSTTQALATAYLNLREAGFSILYVGPVYQGAPFAYPPEG